MPYGDVQHLVVVDSCREGQLEVPLELRLSLAVQHRSSLEDRPLGWKALTFWYATDHNLVKKEYLLKYVNINQDHMMYCTFSHAKVTFLTNPS